MRRDQVFITIIVALLIFLCVTLYVGIIDSGKGSAFEGNWSVSLNNVSTMWGWGIYADDDGTFYTASGDCLYAIENDGTIRWKAAIESDGYINSSQYILYQADHVGNRLYAIVTADPSTGTRTTNRGLLLAISDSGVVLWQAQINDIFGGSIVQLLTAGGQIYIYDSQNSSSISVYGRDGSLAWIAKNAYFAPALNPDGTLYVTNSTNPGIDNPTIQWAMRLDAYYPNGTLYWSINGDDFSSNPMLYYHDDRIYIAHNGGVTALWDNGTPLWSITYGGSVDFLGFGSSDQIYLDILDYDGRSIITVSPDGNMSKMNTTSADLFNIKGVSGNTFYNVAEQPAGNSESAGLESYNISAYSMDNGSLLWDYVVVQDNPRTFVINSSNTGNILWSYDQDTVTKMNYVDPWFWYQTQNVTGGTLFNSSRSDYNLVSSGNMLYFSYWEYSYEYPPFYNMTNCTYAGGVCAIDDNGNLLWYKETDSYVIAMTARNGTVYYYVNGGRFSAAKVDMAATGLLVAVAYIIIRFFMLGSVTRARTRLDRNENRVRVLNFVTRSPGATLYEISRGTGMNVGTVRYHLFILTVNHRIKGSLEGKKYVRYFVNCGAYTVDEMAILALLRREPIGRLLDAMIACPGLTNREMARVSGLPESLTSRYLRELADEGIAEKRRQENGRLSYVLLDRYKEAIVNVRNRNDQEWHRHPDTIDSRSACPMEL